MPGLFHNGWKNPVEIIIPIAERRKKSSGTQEKLTRGHARKTNRASKRKDGAFRTFPKSSNSGRIHREVGFGKPCFMNFRSFPARRGKPCFNPKENRSAGDEDGRFPSPFSKALPPRGRRFRQKSIQNFPPLGIFWKENQVFPSTTIKRKKVFQGLPDAVRQPFQSASRKFFPFSVTWNARPGSRLY